MATSLTYRVEPIKLSNIEDGPASIRTNIAADDLTELINSIKELGLLQPIVVAEIPETSGHKKYRLLIGSRRKRAFEALGRNEIPARIVDAKSERRERACSVVENLVRKPLSHREAMNAVGVLFDNYDEDIKKVSRATGMYPATIRRYLTLKKYGSSKIIDLVEKRKVSLSDAVRAIQIAQGQMAKAERILQTIIDEQMTSSERKRFIKDIDEKPDAALDKLAKDAKIARFNQKILLDLDEKTRIALKQAARDSQTSVEEVASQAVEEWLKEQGYPV